MYSKIVSLELRTFVSRIINCYIIFRDYVCAKRVCPKGNQKVASLQVLLIQLKPYEYCFTADITDRSDALCVLPKTETFKNAFVWTLPKINWQRGITTPSWPVVEKVRVSRVLKIGSLQIL